MCFDHLRTLALGLPLQVSPIRRNHGRKFVFSVRGECSKEFPRFHPIVQDHRDTKFSLNFGGRRFFTLPVSKLSSRNHWSRMKCTKEPCSRSRALVSSFSPLWKEGLLFIRCSILFAVLSTAMLIVWCGQLRARSFIEAKFMPYICSMLSEYLQREIDFGKVRSISPLSITLESCSIGPSRHEFSCGELPTMKIRVHPFASLRSGKFVIDAVFFQPNILVSQKEDFSWLGIPSHPEDDIKRHSSSEEGIDYRTKTRRLAREISSTTWYRERFEAAREAAFLGYIVPNESPNRETIDKMNTTKLSVESLNSDSFFCMDDRFYRRDHHSKDVGMEYVLKHSELEKYFGVDIQDKSFKFWHTMLSYPLKRKFKREAHRQLMVEAGIRHKQNNLQRSAEAAIAYFRNLDDGNLSTPYTYQGNSLQALDDLENLSSQNNGEEVPINDEKNKPNGDNLKIIEHEKSDELVELSNLEDERPITGASYQDSTNKQFKIFQLLTEQMRLDKENGDALLVNHDKKSICSDKDLDGFSLIHNHFLAAKNKLENINMLTNFFWFINTTEKNSISNSSQLPCNIGSGDANLVHIKDGCNNSPTTSNAQQDLLLVKLAECTENKLDKYQESDPVLLDTLSDVNPSVSMWFYKLKLGWKFLNHLKESFARYSSSQSQRLKQYITCKAEIFASEFTEAVNLDRAKGIEKSLPVTLDSVYFIDGTLLLLGFGDQEPREMNYVDGHVKFQNHYTRLHVQLSGNCRKWRSNDASENGGLLATNVFVDIIDQKWHANLKVENLFAPLFERILELPVLWSKGRATGELHICMSGGEIFPNIHGQLDVQDLSFEILDAPSRFSEITANLCFRGQRIFLHNASGRFGDVPLEASGDFGINPEDGEFHLMCQIPCVEVNSLMRTLKMKPLLFSLAGSVTAVFNCQGPLDAPVFVGSGIISRKTPHLVSTSNPSPASEAVNKNKEAGAVAAFDHIPFSHVSANFTFNTDNCVADLYGMRANLLDGGEIRGAGNVWICPEGEVDESAMDVNLSGNLFFEKVVNRYLPNFQMAPFKIGELNGETKLSGSLLKPRFDIKWCAPKAEDSFVDARGEIIISHDYITIKSSSVAFDLQTKIQTSYLDDYSQDSSSFDFRKSVLLIVEGVDLVLKMRGFEFSSLFIPNPLDLPRPVHLKATGKIKFQGKVVKPVEMFAGRTSSDKKISGKNVDGTEIGTSLVGEVSLSGIKLNQLTLAPQLGGSLNISHQKLKLDAIGRADECMSVEVVGPLWPSSGETFQTKTLFSVLLQKGQLRANICYQSEHLANIEVRNLPLDELELASLRGTIQRAELQLNFQKRRGHGVLSVLHPKFSGVLGEALDVAARWSGDVITIEKTVLEQAFSHYEIQGEYVLPGTRDRYSYKEREGLLKKAMDGRLGSVITSMGRWRMRLEVPRAEIAEMLPLARLLSRSIDPAVHSRSKDLFLQSLQSMGFYARSLRELLEAIQRNDTVSDDIVIEEIALPGLAELRGRWRGSLDASGGGDGDTMAEFDFHGENWEWGSYKAQRVLAGGAYSNNSGLRLDNMFMQKDNATLHADGTVLGPITNLHFAVLNFPVSLVPAIVQIIESSTSDFMGSLWQLLAPIKGILHMEGDLRGSFLKPECDVQVRLLDGAVGGIDLGKAEVVASMTPNSRFLFKANFEPVMQSGHVHVQGSVPVTRIQTDDLEGGQNDLDDLRTSIWVKENLRGPRDENEKKIARDRVEDGWDAQLAESLKGLNWNLLDDGEVRVDADIKDGGMALLTAFCPYISWIHGHADINLQVRGTVEQPMVDGSASFHRASVSSPVLQKPLTNLGGAINVRSNRLCIVSMESRVSRRGRLVIKGNLPLKTSESSPGDKIALKCEVFEVRAKNVFSGQVDSQVQITGSILQPNISGSIKLSHGEAYLPHDKGNDDAINRLASKRSSFATAPFSRTANSGHASRLLGSESASSGNRLSQNSDEAVKAMGKIINPGADIRLTDLRLILGPELRILYPLILNFAVSGVLELNGMAHQKQIRPKGILTFENGDVNLVATQVRLKRDHLNVAKFEPDLGLDPTLDLALVGSEWQFRIQSPATRWQDNLVVTSTRSVDQEVLSPTEAAKVFENQLAESLLESDGKLAFKKLATATLETLMPRIEGKGEFGQARWRLVYAPQIPSLLSVDPTVDPLRSLANNISFGTEVEVQLGKRLQASVVRQMKDSEMAMQWTLVYQLTSRLRVLFQSSPSTRLLFEYSATSQN